jgi:23S rRNA pseudouridine2605 synthase
MITDGRVTVNGKIVKELGTKVDPMTDDIHVDGEPIAPPVAVKPVYIMLNKPVGYTCTVTDPNAERTVIELVSQVEERVYPVGRLDVDSAGLLLLTNDGEFANRLTHPRYHVPKVYRVRARGFLDRDAAAALIEGIDLPDGRTAPAEMMFVEYDAATQCTTVDITLFEGRNRQVRRMMDAVGNPVRELTRIRFGNLGLKGLNPGTWRKLTANEIEELLALAKPTPTPPREARRTPQKPLPAPGLNVPVTPAAPKPPPRHKNDVARAPRRPLNESARNSGARKSDRPAPGPRPAAGPGAPPPGAPPRPYGNPGSAPRFNGNSGSAPRPNGNPGSAPRPYGNPGGSSRPYGNSGGAPRSNGNSGEAPRPFSSPRGPQRPFGNAGGAPRSENRPERPAGRPAYESQPPARPANRQRPPAFQPGSGASRPPRANGPGSSGGRPPQGRSR